MQKGIFTVKRRYIWHECIEIRGNSGSVSASHVTEEAQIVNNGSGSASHNDVSQEAGIGNSESSNTLHNDVTEEGGVCVNSHKRKDTRKSRENQADDSLSDSKNMKSDMDILTTFAQQIK